MTELKAPPKPALELLESIVGLYELLEAAAAILAPVAACDDPAIPAAQIPETEGVYTLPLTLARRANVLHHRICAAIDQEPETLPGEAFDGAH